MNDRKLLAGMGGFVDDLRPQGVLHAHIVRSPVAHGRLVRFQGSAAAEHSAVAGVLTPRELQGRTLRCWWQQPTQRQASYPVVPDVVRYQGEALGLVVATSRAAAEDAAELVDLEIAQLPAVTTVGDALQVDAPLLYPEWGTNVVVDFEMGDPAEVTREAIARVPHRLTRRLRIQRQNGVPMETRGVVASWDAGAGQLTVWTSTQVPHHVRDSLAMALGLPLERVRVITPDVGGGFGPKDHLYPDEVLVALAAIRLGRPVKWIEDRSEHFVATVHARDHECEATLALDPEGRFAGLRLDIVADLGAHASNVGAGPAVIAAGMLEGPYKFPVAGSRVRAVVTNKTPIGAYRGFGMPEATWIRERLIEEAAREFDFDPVELRRLNLIRREEMPYTTRSGQAYDSGDYVKAFDRAVELIDRPRPLPRDGRLRAKSVVPYVEFTGLGPTHFMRFTNFRLTGFETGVVRMAPDGSVSLETGVSPHGQGLETTLAQIVADRLGVEVASVRVVHGDTQSTPYSSAGTIASRSLTVGGAAALRAAEAIRKKVIQVAAFQLGVEDETNEEDFEIVDGMVRLKEAPDRGRPLTEVAESAWLGWDTPSGFEPGLEARVVFDPPNITYSYATHAFEVSVDPELCDVRVERIVVVHDCGVIVNPTIVEGQIEGAVAQGLGSALLEEFVYDEHGIPKSTSFMDYLLPVSSTVPDLEIEHIETPSRLPGGFKGMGEGGTVTASAGLANALAALFPESGPKLNALPLTPSRLWEWLRGARGTSGSRWTASPGLSRGSVSIRPAGVRVEGERAGTPPVHTRGRTPP